LFLIFCYCFEVVFKVEVEVVPAAVEVEVRPMGDVVEQDGDA
jgi:hypothetical protein